MKHAPEYIVYLVGVLALGLGYGTIKSALGGQWLFVVCVLAYLLTLRLLGVYVARRSRSTGPRSDA